MPDPQPTHNDRLIEARRDALAEIDAEMGFTSDITSTWATPVQVEAGDHEGAWALPAPPAGDPPGLTLEVLPEADETLTQ